MAYLARWPEWLHASVLWWLTTEALAGSALQENCIYFLCFHCCDPSPLYCSFSSYLSIALFSCSFSFCVIFSLCLSASLSISFLFLPALPPLLCQHFIVDIQLLAGHSIVIPFRAAPFSAGLKQPFKLHPRLPSELPLCKMLFSNISGATT